MGSFRVHKTDNFTIINNNVFRDRRLSWKAKGILTQMLSLPEEWDYTEAGLAKLAADGITSTRSALKELEEAGYLVRSFVRVKGRITDINYDIYEVPVTNTQAKNEEEDVPVAGESSLGNPITDEPILENPMTAEPFLGFPITEKPISVFKHNKVLIDKILSNKELSSALSENPHKGFEDWMNLCKIDSKYANEILSVAKDMYESGDYCYKQKILSLTPSDIANMSDVLFKNELEIFNRQAYIKSMLMNPPKAIYSKKPLNHLDAEERDYDFDELEKLLVAKNGFSQKSS